MHCQTTVTIPHKRGLSFNFIGSFEDANGNLMLLAEMDITSKIVDSKGSLVSTCQIQKSPDGYHYTAIVTDTSTWPLGILYSDIALLLPDGSSAAAETFLIESTYSPSLSQ